MLNLRRVQLMLAEEPSLTWVRVQCVPNLHPRHVTARYAWARHQLERGAGVWKWTIFSDEKRFSLDGPDMLASYWRDRRGGYRWQPRRQQGGGGLMVWGCFSYRGKGKLVVVENNMDAKRYTDVLEESLLPFLEELNPEGATFQQDGASSHRAIHTKKWLYNNMVSTMIWPACSPDMNPIENLWSQLSRTVSQGGRQFDEFDDLREAIFHAWDIIPLERLQSLATSMPRRLVELVDKRGGPTKY